MESGTPSTRRVILPTVAWSADVGPPEPLRPCFEEPDRVVPAQVGNRLWRRTGKPSPDFEDPLRTCTSTPTDGDQRASAFGSGEELKTKPEVRWHL